MRPAAVDWGRIEPPRWFAEDGWALTPETAGMARLMGRGPSIRPITARVRRDGAPHRVLVGGRNLAGAGDPSARFTLGIDGRAVESWEVPPGFFLRTIDLPAGALAGDGRFAALTMVSTPAAVPSAIEQFDVQPSGEMMWGFDEGWNEAEYSPALGIWHWTSDRAVVRVVGAASPLRVTLRIEPPARYFAAPSEVTASAGPVILAKARLFTENRMTFDVPLDAIGDGRIAIETAQSFVPAQRGGPPDQRRLGLRVFEIRIDRVGLR
jgi:hypothetical protein